MSNIAFFVLAALILANTMLIFDIWYHLFYYKDTKVKKNKKCNNDDYKFKCITCEYNNGTYCSHPKGNCYDFEDAKLKWKSKENIN